MMVLLIDPSDVDVSDADALVIQESLEKFLKSDGMSKLKSSLFLQFFISFGWFGSWMCGMDEPL